MNSFTTYSSKAYTVTSYGSGTAAEIKRNGDAATVFLQGEEAAQMIDTLDATPEQFQDSYLSGYDTVMSYSDGTPAPESYIIPEDDGRYRAQLYARLIKKDGITFPSSRDAYRTLSSAARAAGEEITAYMALLPLLAGQTRHTAALTPYPTADARRLSVKRHQPAPQRPTITTDPDAARADRLLLSPGIVKYYHRDSRHIPGFNPASWPGMGTLIYTDTAGRTLCANCASEPGNTEAINGIFSHDEGPAITCEGCNAEVPSSYGDPEEKAGEELTAEALEQAIEATAGYQSPDNNIFNAPGIEDREVRDRK